MLVASLARFAGITEAPRAWPADLVEGFELEQIDRRPITVRVDSSSLRFVPVD
jgi:hypothetical protein